MLYHNHIHTHFLRKKNNTKIINDLSQTSDVTPVPDQNELKHDELICLDYALCGDVGNPVHTFLYTFDCGILNNGSHQFIFRTTSHNRPWNTVTRVHNF